MHGGGVMRPVVNGFSPRIDSMVSLLKSDIGSDDRPAVPQLLKETPAG